MTTRPRAVSHAIAAAKINLTLHVTGQRADGYHLLDSLVVFAQEHDCLTVSPAAKTRLTIRGDMAQDVPAGPDNLVLRAAALMGVTADIGLQKLLPVSAGIGGGSADAAACLRALSDMSGVPVPDNVLSLGADVPVCLRQTPTRMSRIGDVLDDVDGFPDLDAVLINPRVGVSTGQVFAAMQTKRNAPMPDVLPEFDDATSAIKWLAEMRNDMQAPAIGRCPQIADVIAALSATNGIGLARMSGSGATCFGLYPQSADAKEAARALAAAHPAWWVRLTVLGSAPK